MRYENCPKCEGKLGVPDKKRGSSITCPVCGNEFVTDMNPPTQSKTRKSPKSPKPKLRSIPLPSDLMDEPDEVTSVEESPKPRLTIPGPPSPPPLESTPGKKDKSAVSVLPKSSTGKSKSKSKKKDRSVAKPVAKIIQTESVEPQLTKEGKLPSLQLSDDPDPNPVEKPLSENPAFLGAIVCVSILLSGLMLLFAQPPQDKAQAAAEQARTEIKKFYEVRIDEDPEPYQLDLRQAQLAHSRGDYLAETHAYQRVMLRFRTEDDGTPFKITGSKEWDQELHELVSTLLNEAKRLSR